MSESTNRIRRSKYSVKGYKKLRAEHTQFEKCPSLRLPAQDGVEYRLEEEMGTCYRWLGGDGDGHSLALLWSRSIRVATRLN